LRKAIFQLDLFQKSGIQFLIIGPALFFAASIGRKYKQLKTTVEREKWIEKHNNIESK